MIDKNEAANYISHMTFIFRNNANPQDVSFMPNNEWLNNIIVDKGLETRDFWSSEATLVYISNQIITLPGGGFFFYTNGFNPKSLLIR